MNVQRFAFATLLTLAVGCQKPTATGPNIVTAGNGTRQVRAEVAGPVWVKPNPEQITVSLIGHQLVIASDRLLLDGTEAATLDPAALTFDVSYSNNTLRVMADGKEVLGKALEPR